MRIDSKEIIAGQPVFKIRKLLRANVDHIITQESVEQLLDVPSRRACKVLRTLEESGYIEPLMLGTTLMWTNTIAGNALAFARASRPIKRSTADRHLKEFLERVRAVNASDSGYLFCVERVALYGSMLGDRESVGDIDLAVLLKPAIRNRRRLVVQMQRRGREGFLEGRTSSDPVDQFLWPEKEVWLFLKNRCRALGLSELSDEWLRIAPHRIIYQRGRRVLK